MASFATHMDEDSSDDDDDDDDEVVVQQSMTTAPTAQDQQPPSQEDESSSEEEETLVPTADRFRADADDDESDDAEDQVVVEEEEVVVDDEVEEDDDDDDDNIPMTTMATIKPNATLAASKSLRIAPPTTTTANDGDDDNDSDESDDGDLPLATPYPWAHDDYELTLHHDPKRRKRIGTGVLYMKRLLYDTPAEKELYEEANVLSAPAKVLLKRLMNSNKKGVSATGGGDSSDEDEEEEEEDSDDEEEEDDDDEEHEQLKKRRRHLPGPRFWTNANSSSSSMEVVQQVQSKHPQSSLFWNILQAVDTEQMTPTEPFTTRHIIRVCALTLQAGVPPGGMDAKEFICCILHFLSSAKWDNNDDTQGCLPTLPLLTYLESTPRSDVRDLEKRSYQKAYGWTLGGVSNNNNDDDNNNDNNASSSSLQPAMVAELERFFYNSPSTCTNAAAAAAEAAASTAMGDDESEDGGPRSQKEQLLSQSATHNPLPWIPRVRFCPRPPDPKGGKKGLGETTFLLKGQPLPARMTGKKGITATTVTAVAVATIATTSAGTKKRKTIQNSNRITTTINDSGGKVVRLNQGKQLPFHTDDYDSDD